MRKSIFILFILITAGWGWATAQNSTSYGSSDPEAKKILDQSAKKNASFSDIKASFTLKTTSSNQDISSSEKGTLWLKGDAFKLLMGDREIISDGKTLWTLDKEIKEVQVTDYEPEADEITPNALFSNFYDKNFLYRLNGSTTVNGVAGQVIEMTPLDKSKPYFKILLIIGKSNQQILSAEIFAKGGYQYTYVVETFSPNTKIAESTFKFDPSAHPGVEEVDLRM